MRKTHRLWAQSCDDVTNLLTLYILVFVCDGTENPVHPKCAIPRGDHELPAGRPGREVLPEGEVAVHGSG